MELFMIDGIAPFFRNVKSKRINWSKIPFADFEESGGLTPEGMDELCADFQQYISSVASAGYNVVTLDDLAHICLFESYPPELTLKLESYRALYRRLFALAAAGGLQVYLTTDLMFFNEAIFKAVGGRLSKVVLWLRERLREVFSEFDGVGGIVFRFGESDGSDVKSDFRSRLILRRPAQARFIIKKLLPVFAELGKNMVFRIWSIGAYRIGDLLWNPSTFDLVFKKIKSKNLIISIKYGESDFFRYLRTNPLFFHSDHKKIVEFQARREYEGFGLYPSFAGFDCEEHIARLKRTKNVVGISVWAQTGGWGKSRRLTYLRKSPVWVELNIFVLAYIARGGNCAQAVREFCSRFLPEADAGKFIEFLRLSDEVIKQLLYISDFAGRQLFFRRLRLPPTLFVFWDRIMITADVGRILSCLVRDKEKMLAEGREALDKIKQMQEMALEFNLPSEGLDYQLATFEILQAARVYFFAPDDETRPRAAADLTALKENYRLRFSRRYSVRLDFSPAKVSAFAIRRTMPLFLRQQSKYRLVDRLLLLRGGRLSIR